MPPEPTAHLIRASVAAFDADPRTSAPDAALSLVFRSYPKNTDLPAVLLKVATLNALYATNIYGLFDVAAHIVRARVDEALARGSHEVIETIACVEIGGRRRRNYSFATKYCSWHDPDAYPIFDKFVNNMLLAYKAECSFADFRESDLRKYPSFVDVLSQFREYYRLAGFSLRELDKFLWWQGREQLKVTAGA